jgi:ABC-type Fe3+-citrate transport system substrate-binding protein
MKKLFCSFLFLTVLMVGCRTTPIRDQTSTTSVDAAKGDSKVPSAARRVDERGLERAMSTLGSTPCNCGFGR